MTDIVERLRSHWGGERIADVSIDVADAADEIERLRADYKRLFEMGRRYNPNLASLIEENNQLRAELRAAR